MAKAVPVQTPVTLQFLSVSDWHGQLDPLDVFGVGRRGGASVISTYWQADRATNPNTVTLTGGDDFGASPPLSNFFDERPAVLAERMMGIQVSTLGNHNFDRGITHLQEMIDLAGAPTSAATPGSPYDYLSANLKNRDDNLDGVEDFTIIEVGRVKVGVVGITNPEAPELVFPGSFGTIEPTSAYPAANKARAAATRAGADIVVAVIHAGVRGFDRTSGAPFGELIDFANNVGGFDVIFGDHTDVQYSGVINDQLVVEARSKGRNYARTLLTIDPGNGRVLDQSVTFVDPVCLAVDATTGACTATPIGAPDPDIEAMLAPYRAELIPILSEVIGQSAVAVPRTDKCGSSQSRLCESLVGNAVTDAMRTTYGTDLALTNSGGLRSALTCPAAGGGSGFCPVSTPPPHPITKGQVLTLLPFGNQSVTLDLTGAELKLMLENGVSRAGEQGRFPQVSGFCFTYDVGRAAGSIDRCGLSGGRRQLHRVGARPDGRRDLLAHHERLRGEWRGLVPELRIPDGDTEHHGQRCRGLGGGQHSDQSGDSGSDYLHRCRLSGGDRSLTNRPIGQREPGAMMHPALRLGRREFGLQNVSVHRSRADRRP